MTSLNEQAPASPHDSTICPRHNLPLTTGKSWTGTRCIQCYRDYKNEQYDRLYSRVPQTFRDAPLPPTQTTELERAYIAGIIDGEGCISLVSRKNKYITGIIQVSNTNQDLLKWLHSIYGGDIDVRRDPRPTRKQCNTWRCHARQAQRVLKELAPYIRLKRRQAEIVLSITKIGRRRWKLTAEDVEQNKRLIFEIRQLNRRGVPCQ